MKRLTIIFNILFVSVFLFHSPCYSLTRGQIREQIRWLIGDVGISASSGTYRWSDDILNSRINIVQEEIAAITKCVSGRTVMAVTEGVREYRLPDDCLNIKRVAFYISNSTEAYKRLDWKSIGGLDNETPNWEMLSSGLPTKYYQRGNYVGIVPPPSSVYVSTYALKVDYVAKPSSMTSDSDIPFNGDYSLYPYHKLIVWGVAIMCKTDDGKITEWTALESKYYQLLNRMIDDVNYQPDKRQVMNLDIR